jgi:transcriptional regulator with XRE-family HTH domain
MPRSKKQNVRLLTPNQVVATNITALRRRSGWTQEEFAERLEKVLGERWSIQVVSAAERSVTGKRVREFTADELVALARTFGVPIGTLFLAPVADPVCRLRVPDQSEGLSLDEMVQIAVGAEDHEVSRRAAELTGKVYEIVLQQIGMIESPELVMARRVIAEAEATQAAIKEIDASRAERGRTARSPFTQTTDEGSSK